MLTRYASILLFTLLIGTLCSAQCDPDRYRNFIFSEVDLTSDLIYGSNIDYQGNEVQLHVDIYEPQGDTETLRPLVLVAHGGSFISGSKVGLDVVPLCEDLAKMGYVVASMQYRLGIPLGFDLEQPATEAVLRGVHDSRAAVRYFRKDVVENDNSWRIDEDNIYMAGVSAGGFIALHHAYLDELNEIPEIIDTNAPGLGGGVEGTSGNPGYSSEIKGIVNIAGALVDVSVMHEGDEPVCSFHGTGDNTVPFGTDMLQMFSVIDVRVVSGSETVHHAADSLGLTNCFQVQWLKGHVPHVTNTMHYDTLLSISSNFISHLICPDNFALDCDYRSLEVISSIDEGVLGRSQIELYPNPTQDDLSLYGLPIDGKSMTYEIIDLTGRVIHTETVTQSRTTVSTSSLTQGLYLIRLSKGIETRTLRFVKK